MRTAHMICNNNIPRIFNVLNVRKGTVRKLQWMAWRIYTVQMVLRTMGMAMENGKTHSSPPTLTLWNLTRFRSAFELVSGIFPMRNVIADVDVFVRFMYTSQNDWNFECLTFPDWFGCARVCVCVGRGTWVYAVCILVGFTINSLIPNIITYYVLNMPFGDVRRLVAIGARIFALQFSLIKSCSTRDIHILVVIHWLSSSFLP